MVFKKILHSLSLFSPTLFQLILLFVSLSSFSDPSYILISFFLSANFLFPPIIKQIALNLLFPTTDYCFRLKQPGRCIYLNVLCISANQFLNYNGAHMLPTQKKIFYVIRCQSKEMKVLRLNIFYINLIFIFVLHFISFIFLFYDIDNKSVMCENVRNSNRLF